MKGKYNKEIFNEDDKNLESFLNAHDVNSTRNDENFVFSHEENNTIKYSNEENAKEIGKEINDNHSNIKGEETKVEQKDIEKITQTQATSAGSTAASAASTVSVIATTAVVAVVGGGLALGQIVEKLRVCQFEKVLVEDNTISYSLALGNDIVRIRAGEENDECAVFVELTCESYQDFKETREINKMGIAEGKFEGLLYDTEYTINVFQTAILTMADTSLLDEPLKVRTESSTPEPEPVPVNAINLNRSQNPLGNFDLYAQVDYYDDVSQYSQYGLYIGLRRVFLNEEETHQGDNQEEEIYPLQRMPDPFDQEFKLAADFMEQITSFEEDSGTAEMELRMAFFTYEEVSYQEEGMSEPVIREVPKILVEKPVSLSSIPINQREYGDNVFVEQVYTSPDDRTDTNLFVSISSTEGRSNFVTCLYDMGEITRADGVEPIALGVVRDVVNEIATLDLLEEDWYFSSDHLYKATVTCDTSNAEDLAKWWAAGNGSGTEEFAYGVNILEVEIRYDDIYFRSVRTEEPAMGGGSVNFYKSYHGDAGIYIANLWFDDPAGLLDMNYIKAKMINSEDESLSFESQLNIFDMAGFDKFYKFSDLPAEAALNLFEDQSSYTCELWVMDNYEGHASELVDGYYNIETWTFIYPSNNEYYPVCPEITYEADGNNGQYYVTVHTDAYWRYGDIYVRIMDGETVVDSVEIGDGEYNPSPVPLPNFTSYTRNDYTVEVYAEDLTLDPDERGLTNVYLEVVNFAV